MRNIFAILFGLFIGLWCLGSVHSQENQSTKDTLLSESFGNRYVGGTSSEEKDRREKQSKEIYLEFLELYQNNEFEAAMLKIEAAIQFVPHGVYYYYYGICFMEMENYEYAEKAFLKALKMFDRI